MKDRAHFAVASPMMAMGFWTWRRLAWVAAALALIGVAWVGLALAFGRPLAGTLFQFGLVMSLPFFFARFLPARLELGPDGLVVRWLGSRRSIPFSSIASIVRYGSTEPPLELGFQITLVSGEVVQLPIEHFTTSGVFFQLEPLVLAAFERFERQRPGWDEAKHVRFAVPSIEDESRAVAEGLAVEEAALLEQSVLTEPQRRLGER